VKTLVLMAVAAACLPAGAVADESWLGQTVLPKETAVPQANGKRLRWNDVPIPSVVQQVQGDWLWLGMAWVQKSDVVLLDDAPAYFTQVIARGNNLVGYLLRGVSWLSKREFDNAIKDLSEAIRLEPGNSNFYCLRGKARYGKHEYDQAMTDFNEAIRRNPRNLIALNDRGVTFNAKEEFGKSLQQFAEVLRLDPRNALAFANRGATWFDLEEYEKSLADFDRAIELDPKLSMAFTNRGRWYMKHGDYPKAQADYTKAIELAPRDWPAFNGLARVYATAPVFEAHIRDGKLALQMAKRACQLSGWDEWMPLASLAAAYAELGDFEAAVKWQTKALAMSQPAKDRDQRDNLKRLELYKSGQPYYDEVSSVAADTADDKE
jgi:tetratricopeptide (TPR) repeat protein